MEGGRDTEDIDKALEVWRQGDVCLGANLEFFFIASLARPSSEATRQLVEDRKATGEDIDNTPEPVADLVNGFVVLSQTCDVVRNHLDRPFVTVAPLITVDDKVLEDARRLRRPSLAYIPRLAEQKLVADLDRTMTIEKGLLSILPRIAGVTSDGEIREFATALARNRARFAFPDDFVDATRKIQARCSDKHGKNSDDGKYLRALREIRVAAYPSWDSEVVQLRWWLIKDGDPVGLEKELNWNSVTGWFDNLLKKNTRFANENITVAKLTDITAQDYVDSDVWDQSALSSS